MPNQTNDTDRVNISRRLSSHAVIGGVLVIYASMVVLMTLAGALGLWEFNLQRLPELGTSFWVWSLASWTVCIYAGGFLSSIISGSIDRRDGVIQGLVTWAAACVLGCIFLGYTTHSVDHVMSREMFFGGFIGDSFALGAAIFGGLAGTKSEVKSTLSNSDKEAKVRTTRSPIVGVV